MLGIGTAAAAASLVFFAMLLSMNGFSERDSNWGLGAFIILSLITAAAAGLLGWWLVGVFVRKGMNGVLAVVISGLLLVAASSFMSGVWAVVGILISEFVRKAR